MEVSPTIEYVERFRTALIIGFSDGQAAVFSALMLYALLPAAELLPETDEGEEK